MTAMRQPRRCAANRKPAASKTTATAEMTKSTGCSGHHTAKNSRLPMKARRQAIKVWLATRSTCPHEPGAGDTAFMRCDPAHPCMGATPRECRWSRPRSGSSPSPQEGTADGEPRTVQRVHEFGLAGVGVADTRLQATRLEILAVGAAGNLPVSLLAGQPHLEVVGLGRTEAHVAGAQQQLAVWQAESLQHFLGVADHLLQLQVRVLGTRDLHHLEDRKSTRLNSSHHSISYAVFCLKKKKT